MQGRVAPAPIFNQRKRQRQAMFSDIHEPKNNPSSSNMPDLMPVGGFSGSGMNKPKGNLGGNNRGSFNPKEAGGYINQQDKNISQNFNQSGSSIRNTNQSNSRNKQSYSFNIKPINNRCNFNQSNNNCTGGINQPTSRTSFNSRQASLTSSNSREVTLGQPFANTNSITFPSNEKYRNVQLGSYHNREQNTTGQYKPGQPQSSRICSNNPYQTTEHPNNILQMNISNIRTDLRGSSSIHKTNNYDGRFQKNAEFGLVYPPSKESVATSSGKYNTGGTHGQTGWDNDFVDIVSQKSMFNNDNKYQPVQKNRYGFPKQQHKSDVTKQDTRHQAGIEVNRKKPDEVDKSLKLVTFDIAGLIRWNQIKCTTSRLLFEIYGMVDSAVLMNESRTGKEFLLNDGSGTLQCLFYEIDRTLPRLIRGQWHRCVGSLEGKSGKMKCVLVRPATNEERKAAKITTNVSELYMQHLVEALSEQ